MTFAPVLWVPTRREGLRVIGVSLMTLYAVCADLDPVTMTVTFPVEGTEDQYQSKEKDPHWHIFNTIVFGILSRYRSARIDTSSLMKRHCRWATCVSPVRESVISMTMTRKQLKESWGHEGRRSGQTWQWDLIPLIFVCDSSAFGVKSFAQ